MRGVFTNVSAAWIGAAILSADASWISVAVGIAGVFLARIVSVDRENKKLGRRQTARETLPLTLVAVLVTAVVVWDNHLAKSPAAFIGLGAGWATITLLDMIARRFIDPAAAVHTDAEEKRGRLRDAPPSADTPFDMIDLLRKVDSVTRTTKYEDARNVAPKPPRRVRHHKDDAE